MTSLTRDLVGYFTRPEQVVPDFDPRRDAPCPICGRPISEDDVRTTSAMYSERRIAVFYRTHRTCSNDSGPTVHVQLDLQALAIGEQILSERGQRQ
jgi:hypothetical protein